MLHVFLLRKLSGGTIVRERIFVIIFEEKEAIGLFSINYFFRVFLEGKLLFK